MATAHVKYGAKPSKPLAKTILLQICMLKCILTTWDFLSVEREYQPLFTVFESSKDQERGSLLQQDLVQQGWYQERKGLYLFY